MSRTVPPTYNAASFNCPHCGAFAGMEWQPLRSTNYAYTMISMAICHSCSDLSLWISPGSLEEDAFAQVFKSGKAEIVYPAQVLEAPAAHEMMPEEVKTDYEEARQVFSVSHRSAAALLRLSLQKLCEGLVGKKGNINELIGSLVSKGMPVKIQRALDAIRIIANNAVHPGELNIDDKPEMVAPLFGLINLIVENQIAQPAAIEDIYSSLPPGALAAVERRDASKT
ncbi:DUF4145 domain-containing protein [Pseudomonas anatoliensis]|uniref:DUF4145 domain-containing protein n=1 Tax=Pseudomonas anatoliensis TaxID=2710589 RepID=UPI001E4E9846|nr:DUF4145 domain-containing protein [Pseudomonas anatoliensis]MBP5958129.1 DUF4145 domain-containing protein [Pseudomonas anatoliensis]